MESSLKLLRTVQVAMLASILFNTFLAERFGPAPKEMTAVFFYAIAALAVFMIGTIFVVRRTMVIRAENVLAATPEDIGALNRWRAGYIATYALSEAVALYGFAPAFFRIRVLASGPFLRLTSRVSS